jgi:hypothetical protein
MAPAVSLIEAILDSDRKAPRKQRHTARRIYDRIRAEVPGCTPAERTVRQYVERRKHALGLAEHVTFVPQSQGIDILQSRSHFRVRQGKFGGISAKSLMQIPPHVIGLALALQLSICQIDTQALPAPF